ncbi:hypothetical protein [Actinomadura bangladeshensis]|uniref:Uncharacterized protein n=1 Tax=Actinomadura bangladeshensis TaxID=453573 RepID=A0A6L9QAV7_9ACTN|nr:hypothetical protein [Actinomadura bangladeshensis]NEA21581.1 hypothetical protein [Actinomadura bangladeshensis]NEA22541.1 hypothetical protein [Actinomadura bangladeshensis]
MLEPQHPVEIGQVYASCDPRGGFPIRVAAYTPGSNRADVVDAQTGKRPRSILTSALHATGTTAAGRERRTGYRLVDGDGHG